MEKLTAKDLRYGNLVVCYNHTFRVGIIEEYFVEPIGRNEGGFAFDDLSAIRLTEEILLKCGFEKPSISDRWGGLLIDMGKEGCKISELY